MAKQKSQKKQEKSNPQKTKLYISIAIALVIGVIIGIAATAKTIENKPSLIQTSCNIDMQTLYEKPCIATEDCYGRLELCSPTLHTCVTAVKIDKTDSRNIRIPDTQKECESNGGTWEVEMIREE